MRVFKLLASVWSLKLLYNAPPPQETGNTTPAACLDAILGQCWGHLPTQGVPESLGKLSSLGHSSEMLS